MAQEALTIANLLDLGNPIITWVVVIVVSVSMLLGLVRRLLHFHSHDFVFRKARDMEATLAKLDKESEDYELMDEILKQELFYANTRMYFTRPERQQIKEWMFKGMVPINFIRKASSNIRMVDGKLTIEIMKVEILFMWLGVVATILFIFWVVYVLFLMATNGVTLGAAIQLGIISAAMLFVWRTLDPVFYARKVMWRLGESGLLNEGDSGDSILISCHEPAAEQK